MFKMFFTQPQSRAHIFITQNLFNELISVAGYKLPFGDKICGSKFWQIFRGFILAYDQTVTILSRLIFAFAESVLLISRMLQSLAKLSNILAYI